MATKKKATAKKTSKKKVLVKRPIKRTIKEPDSVRDIRDGSSLQAYLAVLVTRVDVLVSRLETLDSIRSEITKHLSTGVMSSDERRLAQHILNISLGVDPSDSNVMIYGKPDKEEIADLIDKSEPAEPENIEVGDGEKFRVTIKAEVTKTVEVNAQDEGDAVEKAHESFDVLSDPSTPEHYNEEAVKVEKVEAEEQKTAYGLVVGDRVRATMRIAFADMGKDNHIHAEEGDEGTVEFIDTTQDEPVVTVRFDSSGTATIVTDDEVVKV